MFFKVLVFFKALKDIPYYGPEACIETKVAQMPHLRVTCTDYLCTLR